MNKITLLFIGLGCFSGIVASNLMNGHKSDHTITSSVVVEPLNYDSVAINAYFELIERKNKRYEVSQNKIRLRTYDDKTFWKIMTEDQSIKLFGSYYIIDEEYKFRRVK